MSPDRAAYAILGLRPGAGRAEVNDAYRRLMKQHHPDRPGGDANRAAEINRAYTYLRRRLGEPVRIPVAVPVRRRPTPFRARRLAFLLLFLAVGISALLAARDDRRQFARQAFAIVPQFNTKAQDDAGVIFDPPLASLNEPVQPEIVQKAIVDAISFHTNDDLAGAAAYSGDCQKSLRRERTLAWFDACAAFDEAMLTLYGDRDLAGTRPFNDSAVIAREVAATRIFADGSLGADAHLHEIRSQVDLAILPMLDSAAAKQP